MNTVLAWLDTKYIKERKAKPVDKKLELLPNEHLTGPVNYPTFSDSQKEAVGRYMDNSEWSNIPLRKGVKAFAAASPSVSELDSVTGSTKIKKPASVFRGLATNFENIKPGTIINDKGYTSTSLDPFQANDFSRPSSEGKKTVEENRKRAWTKKKPVERMLAHIHLPARTKGAHLPTVLPRHRNADENEFLLPRDSRFKVIGHEKRKIGKTKFHIVHMIHLPKKD